MDLLFPIIIIILSLSSLDYNLINQVTSTNPTLNSNPNLNPNPARFSSSFACLEAKNATNTYRDNVDILYDKFINQASVSRFYNTTAGHGRDRVYGYYMCRGDTTPQECHDCIANATRFAQDQHCEYEDGLSYSERCVFQYGAWKNFEVIDTFPIGLPQPKSQQYNETLVNTIDGLIEDAAYPRCNGTGNDGSSCVPGFATREMSVTGENQTIYGLGQCRPDTVGVNCGECLRLGFLGFNDYRLYQGGSIYRPNCLLMYDNTSFYHIEYKVAPSKSEDVNSQQNNVTTMIPSNVGISNRCNVGSYVAMLVLLSCIFIVLQ